MLGTLVTIKNGQFIEFQGSPGKSLQVDMESIGGYEADAEIYHPSGFYSKPQDNIMGISVDVEGMNIIVASHDYNFDKDVDKGEAILYSYDASGNVLSSCKVNKDGEFIVNDGSRSAVAFDKLKEGFDQLKSDFNAFLTHMHPTAATGPPSVPAPPATPSTASIDDSEVDKVLLP